MEKKWRKKKMNYYEVLRIPSTASLSEIKNAYKKLVKRYHPDIYEGNKLFAESKIKEINEAYETLSEKSKKEIYDAELNYKKYEPTKDSYVKTSTKEEIKNYTKVYYNNVNKNINHKTKVEKKTNKKILDLNAIGKKYFFKLDESLQTDEKENLLIMLLLIFIVVLCFGLLNFIK